MALRSGAHGGLMCPLEKGVRGIETGHQMPGRSWRAMKASGDGKPVGPDRPLEKGVRGIETSGSGYLREQIRGGRKGRAERQGLGQSPNKTTGCASEKENEIFLFSQLSLYFPPDGG